jgi:hypothetical protein
MRFLIIGDGNAEIHERAAAAALRRLGHEVDEVYWSPYFRARLGIGTDEFRSFSARLQNWAVAGPILAAFSRDAVAAAAAARPDVVIAYRPTHVTRGVLEAIRAAVPHVTLVSLNNDDPFGPHARPHEWRHLFDAMPVYDLHFVYREVNLGDYRARGARDARMLRSFYIPERSHPLQLDDDERRRLGSDVVFIGHYEDDGRLELLEAVAAAGFDLRVWGFQWEKPMRRSAVLRKLPPPRYLAGDAYNRVLNASKIALCFLSAINRDTYTRRCFEVPAAGTLLLSQDSADLRTLFREGVEAAFFRDRDELLSKIAYYLHDDAARRAVAERGRRRVEADGHDVVSRMAEAVRAIQSVRTVPQGVS